MINLAHPVAWTRSWRMHHEASSEYDALAVGLAARAQDSFNAPLLRSEQIGIPNASGVSPFDATSWGGGLRLGGAAAGTLSSGSLTLEYGRAERSDVAAASNRFTISSAFRF